MYQTIYHKQLRCLLSFHMMFVSFKSNTTGVTSGAGTAYPPGIHGFNPRFLWFPLVLLNLKFSVSYHVDDCLLCCLIGQCIVYPAPICGVWIPHWYFQTLLTDIEGNDLKNKLKHFQRRPSWMQIVNKDVYYSLQSYITKQNGYFIGSDVHILFPENSKRKIKHANYFIMACILNYYAWHLQFKNNASKM